MNYCLVFITKTRTSSFKASKRDDIQIICWLRCQMIEFKMQLFLLTSSSRSTMGVCLLAGVMQRLSMIRTLMKSKTYFLAGWLVRDVLEPTLQYSDWLRFIPESPAKALNSSVGEPASSSKSLTCSRWRDFLQFYRFKNT